MNNNDIDSPLSDSIYYSPNNSENESESPLFIDDIIDCNCLNKKDSCLIFCFNAETNQFESINCKIFKSRETLRFQTEIQRSELLFLIISFWFL